jgi:ATP-dependent DNA ligase
MKEMVAKKEVLASHIHVVKNIRRTGATHSYTYLDSVVAAKGEGVMVRQPHALYIPTLTTSLLKVKVLILQTKDNLITEIGGYRSACVSSIGERTLLPTVNALANQLKTCAQVKWI